MSQHDGGDRRGAMRRPPRTRKRSRSVARRTRSVDQSPPPTRASPMTGGPAQLRLDHGRSCRRLEPRLPIVWRTAPTVDGQRRQHAAAPASREATPYKAAPVGAERQAQPPTAARPRYARHIEAVQRDRLPTRPTAPPASLAHAARATRAAAASTGPAECHELTGTRTRGLTARSARRCDGTRTAE